MTKDEEILGIVLLLARGVGGKGTVTPGKPTVTKKVVKDAINDVADGAKLVARANQSDAQTWVSNFEALGAPAPFARALARWAGIESSGHPEIPSKLGERGLLQISRATALQEKAITQAEWDALGNPNTTRDEQARIGIKLVEWLWKRASKYVAGPFAEDKGQEFIDRVWYAKLYHQRPVDVRDGKMRGPAADMSRELAKRWANDAKKLHYLRAANVVAWGTPEPP